MIISQIRAENILRYTKLHLAKLPSAGIIGISGPNESGKTSIVEIICLALFGRTSTVEATELTKIIKWGQFSAALWVDFRVRDGHTYTVSRQFDGDGTCTAQLAQRGSPRPLARGLEAVNEMIVQLGGFTYQRFVDSFYLAQRNIIAPEVLKQTVRVLSGIQTLNNISAECESEIRAAQDALIPLESKIGTAQQQLTDLNIQEAALDQLQTQHQFLLDTVSQAEAEIRHRTSASAALRTAVQRIAQQVEHIAGAGLASSLVEWQDRAHGLNAASQELAGAYQAAGADATASAGLSSWLAKLEQQLGDFGPVQQHVSARRERQAWLIGEGERPEQANSDLKPLAQRRATLSDQLAAARQGRLLMVGLGGLGIAATFGVLFMGQAVYALGTGGFAFVFLVLATLRAADVVSCRQELVRVDLQADTIRREVQTLDRAGQLSVAEQVAALQTIDDELLSASVASFAEGQGAPLMMEEGVRASLAELRNALAESEQTVSQTQERLEAEVTRHTGQIDTSQKELEQLDQKIIHEQSRLDTAEQLKQHIADLEKERGDRLGQIAVRRAAQQLLDGTHPRLLGGFNLELQKVAGRIVPLLTEQRYANVRVGEDLDLQALSQEKGDFVSLSEISGGTYAQLMLAVRLALSQALISSTVQGEECLILDEPFAFFDAERRRQTLAVLPRISDEIEQTWILAQDFDTDGQLDLHVRCSRDTEELIAV